MEAKSVFDTLSAIDLSKRTEKKNGLTYLSWPWAWQEVVKRYPDASYEIIRDGSGTPYFFDQATGYMVFTSITINGVTRDMWLPVMDGANKAMLDRPYTYEGTNQNFRYATKGEDGVYRDKYGNVQTKYIQKTVNAATMFDINKTIMRCLVKNLAMFGLGLYIYAGEDLPEQQEEDHSGEMCGSTELAVLEAMVKKAYKVEDIKQIFPTWPNLTKGQYATAMTRLKGKQ